MDDWNSDSYFGFDGPASGGDTAVAATPTSGARSTLQPSRNAVQAITDPKGSAIFWIALAAILGLLMVQGQFAVSAKLKSRAGK
jgi:hypothetical protein